MNRLIVLVSFVIALVFPGLLVAQDIPCAEYIHDEPRFTACYQQYVMSPELFAENTHKAMPRIPIELAPAIVGAAAGQVTPHGALDIADLTLRFIAGMPSFAERVTFRPPLVGYLWTWRYNHYGQDYSYREDPAFMGILGVDTLLLGEPNQQWGRSLSLGGDFGFDFGGGLAGHVNLTEGLTIFKSQGGHEVALEAGGDYFVFSEKESGGYVNTIRPRIHGPGWHGGAVINFNLPEYICEKDDCYLSLYGDYGQMWTFAFAPPRSVGERPYELGFLNWGTAGLRASFGMR